MNFGELNLVEIQVLPGYLKLLGKRSDIDLLWFGNHVALAVEISQITPPHGFKLFLLQGLKKIDILSITNFALPFFLLLLVVMMLLTVFPELAASENDAKLTMI